MGKVSESIFSNEDIVIAMADVQHIERKRHDADLVSGKKKGDLMGLIIVTKNTTWNADIDFYNNSIWLDAKHAESFMKAWCIYRHELEA